MKPILRHNSKEYQWISNASSLSKFFEIKGISVFQKDNYITGIPWAYPGTIDVKRLARLSEKLKHSLSAAEYLLHIGLKGIYRADT